MATTATGSLPSIWRASSFAIALGAVMGGAFGALLALAGEPWAGLFVGALVAALPVVGELQAQWRIRRGLARFAEALGPPVEAESTRWGDQRCRWEDPPVEVDATTYKFTVRGLYVTFEDQRWQVPLAKADQGAREVLVKAGRRTPAGAWNGDVPGPGPASAGAVAAGLALVVSAGLTLLVAPEPVWPVVAAATGLAGGLAATGNVRARHAVVRLAEAVRAGGVEVADLTHTTGRALPGYDLYTPYGVLDARIVAVPGLGRAKGAVQVDHGERGWASPLSGIEALGREVAGHLREEVGW